MSENLVKIFLDMSGGFSRKKEIDPEKLQSIPDLIRSNLATRMAAYGTELIDQLLDAYTKAIRVRPRVEGEHLMERLRQAMNKTVRTPQRKVWLGVFEVQTIDRLTRNEGLGTSEQGWFLGLEDDHGTGRAHGSEKYKFVGLDLAVQLANEAADNMKLSPNDRAKFVDDVEVEFAGRHGEGIMVDLDKPLFFKYPQYGQDTGKGGSGEGKARNLVGDSTHPGYPALDVLSKVSKTVGPRLKELAHLAVQDAGRTL